MVQKVVPEKVIPQNIVEFLIDETAELPEPDAFTFLTRLRTLGIGSADFLYLMEGCGAPQAAVDKIKANPAMNLQSLILTLEGAGMTSKDYTRILYTARQIWERTLTLRLENSEKISDGDYPDESAPEEDYEEYSEPDFEEVMEEAIADEGFDEGISWDTDEGSDADNGEDEETVVSPETDGAEPEISDGDFDGEDSGEAFSDDDDFVYTLSDDFGKTAELSKSGGDAEQSENSEDEYVSPSEEDIPKQTRDHFTVEISYDDDEPSEPQDGSDKADAPSSYNGDTTAIIRIDRELLKENLSKLAEEAEEAEPETPPETEVFDEDFDNDDFDDDDFDDDDFDDDLDDDTPVYHTASIVAAAVGAAVLVGASLAAGHFLKLAEERKIQYAADERAIFSEIYRANEEKFPGGEIVSQYVPELDTIFGDLLVHSESFGVLTEGDYVYSVGTAAISASSFKNGELASLGELKPPNGAEIVAAFEKDGAIVAVYSGDKSSQCGYMMIRGGQTLYTVRQDGTLTDYSVEGGSIKIGSVYTPKFYANFTIDEFAVYLPKTGKDEPIPIAPQSVILSKTKGYSYAVSAEYSLADGGTESVCAAIGDPVYAGADGFFAFNDTDEGKGVLILADLERQESEEPEEGKDNKDAGELLTAECGIITAAAVFEGGSAVCENGEIVLRDSTLTAVTKLVTLADNPKTMRFSGSDLIASGNNGVFLTANCASLEMPVVMGLTTADGICRGEFALVYGVDSVGADLTRLKLENGRAIPASAYSKELSAEQLATLAFGAYDTFIVSDRLCGAAYSYFDGVSVVSEYAVLGDTQNVTTLYDDRTGFTLAFESGGVPYAVCSEGAVNVANNS